MDKKQKSELGVGTVFLVFGVYIFREALKLKGEESLAHSGAFFPLIIASIIILLSIVLMIRPIGQAIAISRAKEVPAVKEPILESGRVGPSHVIEIQGISSPKCLV